MPESDQEQQILILARWAHEKFGHLGTIATREWEEGNSRRGIPSSADTTSSCECFKA